VGKYRFSYLLTTYSRVLLEKLTGLQLVKKYPHFMEPEGSLPHSQVPYLSYPEPARSVHNPTSHFLMIHLNIILLSMPGSSKWSLDLRFPHQTPLWTSNLPHTCYMHRPSQSSRFYHSHNIWWAVQIIKFLIMQFSQLPCHLVLLRHKYSPQHPILKYP